MYEDLFNKLASRNKLEENLHTVCEGMSWEQIAIALYDILDDIDTADDICKENTKAFQNMVMKFQAKKNEYMCSPDGYTVEPVVDIEEATATALGSAEQQMKEVYKDILNTELKNSIWATETDWKKFWLLTDGTVVPVRSSHVETAHGAGVSIIDLKREGSVSGYIEEDEKEMGISGFYDQLTFKQISTIRNLYNKYDIDIMLGDMFNQKWARVPSGRDLIKYLRTGKGREKKAWEAAERLLDEAVATLSEPEEKLKKHFKNRIDGELTRSTYPGEPGYKFWLLTDGSYVPVRKFHREESRDAGLKIGALEVAGAFSVYIDPEKGEFDLRQWSDRARPVFTSEQISTVIDLFNEYPVDTVTVEGFPNESAQIGSARELSRYLRSGVIPRRKSWESISEDVLDILEQIASCSEINIMEVFDKLGRRNEQSLS